MGSNERLWRWLKEGETNDLNKFDIWSVMKSDKMRKFYKRHIKLGINGCISIICSSRTSMESKIIKLKELLDSDDLDEKYISLINDIIELYNTDIRILNNPRCVNGYTSSYKLYGSNFHLNSGVYKNVFEDTVYFVGEFNNYNDIKRCVLSETEKYDMWYIVIILKSNINTLYYATLSLQYENNEKEVNIIFNRYTGSPISDDHYDYDIFKDDKKLLYHMYPVNQFFYIPFENLDKIYLSIPEFNRPIIGEIRKGIDCVGMDYVWLRHACTNNVTHPIALHPITLDFINLYSIFDVIGGKIKI